MPPIYETVWQFLKGLNIELYYPAISLLDVYSREMKIREHTKTYIWLFIVVIFIIAKKLK